jgi:hypothetical protein
MFVSVGSRTGAVLGSDVAVSDVRGIARQRLPRVMAFTLHSRHTCPRLPRPLGNAEFPDDRIAARIRETVDARPTLATGGGSPGCLVRTPSI